MVDGIIHDRRKKKKCFVVVYFPLRLHYEVQGKQFCARFIFTKDKDGDEESREEGQRNERGETHRDKGEASW